MQIKEGAKIALVLGGGGVKAAAYHVGVCLALQEKGFNFAGGSPSDVQKTREQKPRVIDIYVGSSAGAIISSYLASGYSISSLLNSFKMDTDIKSKAKDSKVSYLKPINYRDLFHLNGSELSSILPTNLLKKPFVIGGLEVLLKHGFKLNGLFTTQGIEKYLRTEILPYNSFDQIGAQLYIVATQLNHSRKVIFGSFDEPEKKLGHIKWCSYAKVSDAVAASASLPPAYAPYGIKNHKGKEIYYFDGEIRDTLSTHVAEDFGADIVISSYSIQPYHYTEEIGSLHKFGIPVIINQALYQVVHQKISRYKKQKEVYSMVEESIKEFFNKNNLPQEKAEALIDSLSQKLEYNPNVQYIYLHPSPQNHELFFMDHFSLNPKVLGRIVKYGFTSAIRGLRKYGI